MGTAGLVCMKLQLHSFLTDACFRVSSVPSPLVISISVNRKIIGILSMAGQSAAFAGKIQMTSILAELYAG